MGIQTEVSEGGRAMTLADVAGTTAIILFVVGLFWLAVKAPIT